MCGDSETFALWNVTLRALECKAACVASLPSMAGCPSSAGGCMIVRNCPARAYCTGCQACNGPETCSKGRISRSVVGD